MTTLVTGTGTTVAGATGVFQGTATITGVQVVNGVLSAAANLVGDVTDATGNVLFTVNQSISPSYLRWKGIDATLELAKSPNSKIVVIGTGGDGLPIILGGLEGTTTTPAATPPP